MTDPAVLPYSTRKNQRLLAARGAIAFVLAVTSVAIVFFVVIVSRRIKTDMEAIPLAWLYLFSIITFLLGVLSAFVARQRPRTRPDFLRWAAVLLLVYLAWWIVMIFGSVVGFI